MKMKRVQSNIKEKITKQYQFRSLGRYISACILTTSSIPKSLVNEGTKSAWSSSLDIRRTQKTNNLTLTDVKLKAGLKKRKALSSHINFCYRKHDCSQTRNKFVNGLIDRTCFISMVSFAMFSFSSLSLTNRY